MAKRDNANTMTENTTTVIDTVDEAVIFVPPLAEVYHPSNVYPALLVVASVPYVWPFVTVFDVGDGVEPPFALNVTVYEFVVQWAYNVWFAVIDTIEDAVTFVPPLAEVYHPANVYPVLLVVASVP